MTQIRHAAPDTTDPRRGPYLAVTAIVCLTITLTLATLGKMMRLPTTWTAAIIAGCCARAAVKLWHVHGRPQLLPPEREETDQEWWDRQW